MMEKITINHVRQAIKVEENDKSLVYTVTEWANGDGWDIGIGDDVMFSLSWESYDLIKQLIHSLELQGKIEDKISDDTNIQKEE